MSSGKSWISYPTVNKGPFGANFPDGFPCQITGSRKESSLSF